MAGKRVKKVISKKLKNKKTPVKSVSGGIPKVSKGLVKRVINTVKGLAKSVTKSPVSSLVIGGVDGIETRADIKQHLKKSLGWIKKQYSTRSDSLPSNPNAKVTATYVLKHIKYINKHGTSYQKRVCIKYYNIAIAIKKAVSLRIKNPLYDEDAGKTNFDIKIENYIDRLKRKNKKRKRKSR